MTEASLFQSNGSQTMRLPKHVAFPADVKRVRVLRDSARRVIVPVDSQWDDFFDAPGVDLGSRDQPKSQARERS